MRPSLLQAIWSKKGAVLSICISISVVASIALIHLYSHSSTLSGIVNECNTTTGIDCNVTSRYNFALIDRLPKYGVYVFHQLDSIRFDASIASDAMARNLRHHKQVTDVVLLGCVEDNSDVVAHFINCTYLASLKIHESDLSWLAGDSTFFSRYALNRLQGFSVSNSKLTNCLIDRILNSEQLRSIRIEQVQLVENDDFAMRTNPHVFLDYLWINESVEVLKHIATRVTFSEYSSIVISEYTPVSSDSIAELLIKTEYFYIRCEKLGNTEFTYLLGALARLVACTDKIATETLYVNSSSLGLNVVRHALDLLPGLKEIAISSAGTFSCILESIRHYPKLIHNGYDLDVLQARDFVVLRAVCLPLLFTPLRSW